MSGQAKLALKMRCSAETETLDDVKYYAKLTTLPHKTAGVDLECPQGKAMLCASTT